MNSKNVLHASSREEWRAWLAERHATETEVWLVSFKQHTGQPRISYDAAVEEALCFGWIDSVRRKFDDDRFAQKYTPRKPRSQWSQSNLERVSRLTAEGKMTEAGLAKLASDAAPPPARFETGAEIPAFVEQAFRANETAWKNFQSLAPSYRRDFVRWVIEAKKEETRERRLREAVERLERNEKLGMK